MKTVGAGRNQAQDFKKLGASKSDERYKIIKIINL